MKKPHSEEQIIRILREAEAHEVPIRDAPASSTTSPSKLFIVGATSTRRHGCR